MDFATAPSDVALAYLTMLAIDSLVNVVMGMEVLVDRSLAAAASPPTEGVATTSQPSAPSKTGSGKDSRPTPPPLNVCCAMMDSSWKTVLQVSVRPCVCSPYHWQKRCR